MNLVAFTDSDFGIIGRRARHYTWIPLGDLSEVGDNVECFVLWQWCLDDFGDSGHAALSCIAG
jgi:hypothetical protein